MEQVQAPSHLAEAPARARSRWLAPLEPVSANTRLLLGLGFFALFVLSRGVLLARFRPVP